MSSTKIPTTFGPVKTSSTRPFLAVVKTERPARIGTTSHPEGISIHARAETRKALETRLGREGFRVEASTGLFRLFERSSIIEGVPTPGALIATVEIVSV